MIVFRWQFIILRNLLKSLKILVLPFSGSKTNKPSFVIEITTKKCLLFSVI